MTCDELIEMLKKFPGETEVRIEPCGNTKADTVIPIGVKEARLYCSTHEPDYWHAAMIHTGYGG